MRSIAWTSCGLVTTTAMCLRRPSPTLHMFVWTSRSRWRRCRSHCPSRLSWKLCSSSWWTTLFIRSEWLSQWLASLLRSYFIFFCHNWEISQVSLLKLSATSLLLNCCVILNNFNYTRGNSAFIYDSLRKWLNASKWFVFIHTPHHFNSSTQPKEYVLVSIQISL